MQAASLVKLYRLQAGLTVADVAATVRRSPGWVSAIERGHRLPTEHERDRLSDALGVDLSDLIPAREERK